MILTNKLSLSSKELKRIEKINQNSSNYNKNNTSFEDKVLKNQIVTLKNDKSKFVPKHF